MKQSLVKEFWDFLNTIVTSTVTTTVSTGKDILGNLFEEYEKDVKKSGSEDIVWESNLTFSQFYYANNLGSVNKPTKIYVSLVGEDTEAIFDKDPSEFDNYPNLGFFTFVGPYAPGSTSSLMINILEEAFMDALPAALENVSFIILSSSENEPSLPVCSITATRRMVVMNSLIQRSGTGSRVFMKAGTGGLFLTLQGRTLLNSVGIIKVGITGDLTIIARETPTFLSGSITGETGSKLNLINETIVFGSDPVPRTLEAMDVLFPTVTTNSLYIHSKVDPAPQ